MQLTTDTTDAVDEPWLPERMYLMLRLCDDDVAAFLMAANAFHPGELRTLAAHLGLDPGMESLRELTVQVVVKARAQTEAQERTMRGFVRLWGKDRRAAAEEYHAGVF